MWPPGSATRRAGKREIAGLDPPTIYLDWIVGALIMTNYRGAPQARAVPTVTG
jgi:hypothetical protein